MFDKTISDCNSLEDLSKDSSDEVVAREARVRGESAKRIKRLLKEIKMAGVERPESKPKVLI